MRRLKKPNTHVSCDELPLPLRVWELLPKAQGHLESWQRTAMVSKRLQLYKAHKKKPHSEKASQPSTPGSTGSQSLLQC